jgi:hypothetical protein
MRYQSLVPSCLTSFHTRELSSTTPLVPQEGAVFGQRRFQRAPSIWEGSVAAAFWAVPQPRLLPRHNIAGIGEGRQTYVGPPISTQDSYKERGRKY